MPLKTGTGELRLVESAVHFPMEDVRTGKRVICRIDTYALKVLGGADDVDYRFAAPSRYPGHMQVFLDFRERIEKMAGAQYDEGYSRPFIGGEDVELG